MLFVLTGDVAFFSFIQQISVPLLCSRPVPSTGASVLNVGKVLVLKSLVFLENILLTIWDFSSCIKFLFTVLLSLNTEGPPLVTVLYFTPEYNLDLNCWHTERFSLRQGIWLLSPVPDCTSQDLKNSVSLAPYVENCSVSLKGKNIYWWPTMCQSLYWLLLKVQRVSKAVYLGALMLFIGM